MIKIRDLEESDWIENLKGETLAGIKLKDYQNSSRFNAIVLLEDSVSERREIKRNVSSR